jgi:peroxiredoxin
MGVKGMNKSNRTYLRVAILGILLVALIYALYTSLNKEPNAVKVGSKAPNFSLEQLDGPPLVLDDLKGKGVILNFWGTWCEPCKAEMPALQKQYDKYKDKGLVVVGLNIGESPITIEPFVKELGVNFPIVMDRKSEITKLYRIGPIPTTFFISPEGEVAEIFIGEMKEAYIESQVKKILP